MAWLYVPGLADWNSGSCSRSLATVPSLTSRGKPLPLVALSRAWKKGGYIRLLSGMTWSPSMADVGVDTWMSSLPASRVSPGALPVPGKAPPMSAGSGPTSGIGFAKWIPALSGWRMCLPLFPEADWPSFSGIWPTSGSMRSGICSEQPTSGRPIAASDCSYWPTTSEADARSSWPTPNVPNGGRSSSTRNYDEDGNKRQIDLGATATCWPTPASRDYRSPNAESYAARGGESKGEQLPNFVAHLWQTPATDSFRSRSGDRNDEQGLDQQARMWATPRAEDGESCGNHPGAKGGDSLTGQTRLWPTPTCGNPSNANSDRGQDNLQVLAEQMWPTPSVGDSESGQTKPSFNESRGGADHRLRVTALQASRSFLPDPQNSHAGEPSLPSDRTSRQPLALETWSTPRTNCNIQNRKNLPPPSEGGRSSKPGLQDQIQKFNREHWSTPRASGNRTSPRALTERADGGGGTAALSLEQQATGQILTSKSKVKLNPQFVEWLMGWPIGWTGSVLAATEWYRFRARMRSALWQLVRG